MTRTFTGKPSNENIMTQSSSHFHSNIHLKTQEKVSPPKPVELIASQKKIDPVKQHRTIVPQSEKQQVTVKKPNRPVSASSRNNIRLSSAVCYTDKSQKVPSFYSRPGPASYQKETMLEVLSKHNKSQEALISSTGFPKGFYLKTLPKHRFIDFSKREIHQAILENNFGSDIINEDFSDLNFSNVQNDKKLEILKPDLN